MTVVAMQSLWKPACDTCVNVELLRAYWERGPAGCGRPVQQLADSPHPSKAPSSVQRTGIQWQSGARRPVF